MHVQSSCFAHKSNCFLTLLLLLLSSSLLKVPIINFFPPRLDVIVQERRNEMCQNRITPGLHCHGQKIYSIFDSDNQLNGGKRLRCYVEDALTSSELHYFKIYDTAGDSTCFQDLVQELLNITRWFKEQICFKDMHSTRDCLLGIDDPWTDHMDYRVVYKRCVKDWKG